MSFFTSESVSEGHPDKIADQISDAVLDAILSKDKSCAVACETMIKNSCVVLSGEIKTHVSINLKKIVIDVINDIYHNNSPLGVKNDDFNIINLISTQSKEITRSVFGTKGNRYLKAGDQGVIFGYACNETDVYMPAPIYFANQLLVELSKKRKSNVIKWLLPDAKSQVTVEYNNGIIKRIEKVLISTQHQSNTSQEEIKTTVINDIIKRVLPKKYIDKKTKYIVNPSGSFVYGGPNADCGLTGRKIIVDTYGGYARHGGGAFSGKDPSKIDRSASYMARYIAKNIVAKRLACQCEIQLSYGIGIAEPLSININTFGTGKYSDYVLTDIVKKNFDLTPYGIIQKLHLQYIQYYKTAVYGHFGRESKNFPWEQLDALITH